MGGRRIRAIREASGAYIQENAGMAHDGTIFALSGSVEEVALARGMIQDAIDGPSRRARTPAFRGVSAPPRRRPTQLSFFSAGRRPTQLRFYDAVGEVVAMESLDAEPEALHVAVLRQPHSEEDNSEDD